MTNAFSLILCSITLPYTFIFYLMGIGWANLSVPIVGFSYLLCLYLNARRCYYAARILLFSLVNFASFFYSLTFGFVSGVHLLFLPLATVPLMIFERKDRAISAVGFLLSVGLFFGFQRLHEIAWMGAPWIPLPEARFPIIFTVFLISAFLVYWLQRSNDNSDDEILEVLDHLKVETNRSHKILDSITDMIILSDTQSQPLWGNRAFREFYGLNTNHSVDGFQDAVPEILRQHEDCDRRVIDEKRPCWIEAEAVEAPDGGTLWFNTVKSPILNQSGDVTMIVSVCRDVTTQHEMEELLSQQRVQIVASAKLSALGEMAAGIAHEIINPLAIVAGRSLTLRRLVSTDPGNSEKISAFVQDIEDGTYRIVKIIRGLQAFSRSGDNDPFTPVSVQSILDDTLTFCAARFADSGIRLITSGRAMDIILECRPVQISQVLLNIMNNSFDSVKEREEKWVEIGVSRAGDFLEISITDSGPGIPLGIRERIFDPFFTSKPVGEGTGLGLSIARGLVESHRGTIVLDESCSNTRLRIRLPMLQVNSAS